MSCIVICRECMNFLPLTFNVGFLVFCWNVANDRRSSSYICSVFVWTSEQSNWSLMSRTMLRTTSKPSKPVALSDSTNVLKGKISLPYVLPIVPDFSGWCLHWLHTPAPTPACSVGSASSTLQWFHIVGLQSSRLPQVSSISRCDSSNQRVQKAIWIKYAPTN